MPPVIAPEACIKRGLVVEMLVRAAVVGVFKWLYEHLDSGGVAHTASIAPSAMMLICTGMVVVSAPATSLRKFSVLTVIIIALWNALSCWSLPTRTLTGLHSTSYLWWDMANHLIMNLNSFAHQPKLRAICTAWGLLNGALAGVIHINELAADKWLLLALIDISVLFAVGYQVWVNRVQLHHLLAAEQAATRAMLKMTSDAGFWVACDGNTIVRGDKNLDMIMGMAMEGTRLSDRLDANDWTRLQLATKGADEGAKLLPVTLQRPNAAALQAELFIAGTRTYQESIFLIGLRLSSEMWETDPADAERATVVLEADLIKSPSQFPSHLEYPTLGDAAPPEYQQSHCSQASQKDLEAGSCSSTLISLAVESLRVTKCTREQLLGRLLPGDAALKSPDLVRTIQDVLALCCDHARGGAMVLVAERQAFSEVFSDRFRAGPTLRAADSGYMTARLKGIHISDPRFQRAFQEFTEHSEDDRWPRDYPDFAARALPKDGAFVLHTSGYRLKCAAKVLGLCPPRKWHSVGTKHEAALASAWGIRGCIAFVRSDSGSVHIIVRDGPMPHAYLLCPEQTRPPLPT